MADESETPAGGQAGEPLAPTTPQLGTSNPPPLNELAQRAVDEYEQITRELAVVSPFVEAPPSLQASCTPGSWCLPDVNCSARDFTSDAVRTAFFENRRICQPDVE